MAKKLFLLFFLVLAVFHTYGQDIITRSDGVTIQARAVEIKSSLINFKLFQQADSGVYQISTQDVQSVRLADGTTRSFPAPATAAPFNYYTNSGRNILWYYPVDLFYSNFTLAYERVLPSGKVSLKVPLTIGLSGSNDPDSYYTGFRENIRLGAGLEVNFYPFGQGRFQYYLGPALACRSYRTYYYTAAQPTPQRQNAQMLSFALKNGLYYQFTKFFIISVDAGLGWRFFRKPDRPDNYYDPNDRNHAYLAGSLHLGFRF
jgi:hypothetical protein